MKTTKTLRERNVIVEEYALLWVRLRRTWLCPGVTDAEIDATVALWRSLGINCYRAKR